MQRYLCSNARSARLHPVIRNLQPNRDTIQSLQFRAGIRGYIQSFLRAGQMRTNTGTMFAFATTRGSGAGFTLIELLVSVSILLIIISVLIIRFASFDSIVLLRTLAYDIGLSFREAQSYSLSAYGNEGNFRIPYGLSFTPGATSYVFFGYTGSDALPYYDPSNVVVVDLYTLGRSFTIDDVCIIVGGTEDCEVAGLDVSFRRPEYSALFYVPSYSGDQSAIEGGIIKLVSTRNPDIVARVEVSLTGQIEVEIE